MRQSNTKLALVEKCGDIFTTPLFWDCECERDYIHSCLEEACPVCKATQEESSDARVEEVFRYSSELNSKLIAALEALCDSVCPDLVPIPF